MGMKTIVPLCGVDESMVGFSVNGWEIKKILPTSELCTIIDDVLDASLYKQIYQMMGVEDILSIIPFVNGTINTFYLVFVKETSDISDLESIIDVFRILKASQIGCWFPLSFQNGILTIVEKGRSYTTNVLQFRESLSLTDDDKKQLFTILQKRLFGQYPPIANIMLSFFHESCCQKNQYLSFVTRITILEMLIDGNTELSYRLRHHIAIFLGRNKEESIEIAENFKKIYNARSKYLHDGNISGITPDAMKFAYEYSRRVIANLLCIEENISTIRTTLEQSGYGDNPYHITF